MALNLSSAPVKTTLLDGNVLNKVWIQWFSTLSDILSGKWGINKRTLEKQNIATEPDIEYVSYTGREITFLFQWNNGVTFSDSKIFLEYPRADATTKTKSDLTMIGGMLAIYQDDNRTTVGAYASESTITIPDMELTGRVIIQGTILTKVTEQV